MRLQSLSLSNFMPYKGEQHIEFPCEPGRGIVVVYGDNMRGKTSFLNAIRWAFFGKVTARQGRTVAYKDMVNVDAAQVGDWSLWTEVRFDLGSSSYALRRTMRLRRNVAHPQKDADFEVNRTLTKDGERLDSETADDQLNHILPEQISRFFLFDGELLQDYETLVRDANPSSGIKNAIERILGVPALINGRNEVQVLLTQAQTAQAHELRHLRSMRSQAEQQLRIQEQIKEQQKKIVNRNDRKKETESQIAEIQEAIEHLAAEADRLTEYADLKARSSDLASELRALTERRSVYLQEAWRDLLEPRLEMALEDLRHQQAQVFTSIEERAKLAVEIGILENTYQKSECEVCGQEISAKHRTRLAAKIGNKSGHLQTLNVDLASLSLVSSKIELLGRIRGLGTAQVIIQTEKDIENKRIALVQTKNEMLELDAEINLDSQNELVRLTNLLVPLEVSVGKLDQEIKEAESIIEDLSRKQAQIARLLARNPEARRQRTSALVEKYGALDRVLTASVDKLRETQRKRVARFASEAFSKLTSEENFQSLSINSNYGLSILDENSREIAERSAGAEQIVALSLIDGLNKVARRYDPVVMDTPFGRLDIRHRTHVLQYLPEMADQVILLVHEGEMDRDRSLSIIRDHVSAIYEIERVTARQSKLVRVAE